MNGCLMQLPLRARGLNSACSRRRIKYYNDVLFHNVQKGFIVQTGDPTGTGKGGVSVYGCACLFGSLP